MKKYLLSCILSVFLAVHPILSACAAELGDTPGETRPAFVETLLRGFAGAVPLTSGKQDIVLTVPAFVKGLGMPDETVIADDEYCLLGQLHRWCFSDQNLKIVLLADSYSSTVDYRAGSRMFALRKCRDEQGASFEGLWGIRFGDSDTMVKEKLEAMVGTSKGLVLSKDAEEAPIHAFLNDLDFMHQYTVRRGDLRYYFMINKKGLLEVIIISRFDVMRAC